MNASTPSKATDTRAVIGKSGLITLTGVRDVCLGETSLTVTPAKLNYVTKVEANHIMAQLEVSISGLPSDITDLSVTLPYQSNQFDFSGKFFGSSQRIALNIVRADFPAENGPYAWSTTEQLIYPSCNASVEGEVLPSTTPITVVAKDTNGKTTHSTPH